MGRVPQELLDNYSKEKWLVLWSDDMRCNAGGICGEGRENRGHLSHFQALWFRMSRKGLIPERVPGKEVPIRESQVL